MDKAACSTVACDGSLVANDDADKTYDMSTLDAESTYCLGIRANDGADQGTCQEFEFTSASGPPQPEGSTPGIKYSPYGATLKYSPYAGGMIR